MADLLDYKPHHLSLLVLISSPNVTNALKTIQGAFCRNVRPVGKVFVHIVFLLLIIKLMNEWISIQSQIPITMPKYNLKVKTVRPVPKTKAQRVKWQGIRARVRLKLKKRG